MQFVPRDNYGWRNTLANALGLRDASNEINSRVLKSSEGVVSIVLSAHSERGQIEDAEM